MVILRDQNKITDFLLILAWLYRFNFWNNLYVRGQHINLADVLINIVWWIIEKKGDWGMFLP